MKLFESINMMSLFPGECQMVSPEARCVGAPAKGGTSCGIPIFIPDIYRDRLRRIYGVALENNAEPIVIGSTPHTRAGL